MKATTHAPALIALAVAAVLGTGTVNATTTSGIQADEQQCQRERASRSNRPQELYPESTRTAPTERASQRMGGQLNKLGTALDKEDNAQVRQIADEVIANARANNYDKAYAAQLAANAAYNDDDLAAAKTYLVQAVELDALDNNAHFQSMMMLAQLQAQDEEYEQALATLDRYLEGSQSSKADDLALKGQILVQAGRPQDAIPVLRQAIDAAETPNMGWTQALMAAYLDTENTAEATRLAEQIAAASPGDKRSQLNLASMHIQADNSAEAIAIMERLRAEGQLTEDREYRNLFALHLNTEGGEPKAIEVINEGLEKGVLEGNHQTYLALGQAYYFSEQVAPAIDAYQKAAPLAENGETYLNLARILFNEDRIPEAKQAAQQALDKGVRNPDEARKLLAR
ncbi:tetratricopeptide repeat protein [Luteimonas sp. MHLX1A]|uniref:tetratricopeptide repeat protein n=1 Tax=Alterluteimonas muca TaxID=2878684 RepID=UPI001E52CCE5|nr:tetratricopeptide repeat protein [Luteimonas sp. MHLX1A]MCD9047222.1 tetratricopeptide repeat protein [Luteimonas sp. MHLX1A]